MPNRFQPDVLARALQAVTSLRGSVEQHAREHEADIAAAAESCRASAENLVHYLALRQHELRPLQAELARLGLSSLGRAESSVLTALDAVEVALCRLASRPLRREARPHAPIDIETGPRLLARQADALLGPAPPGRGVRIMVTMPSEAATEPQLLRDLLAAGMDLMRINCAHDDPEAWSAMVAHLRAAEGALGRRARVVADVAGPRLRTSALVDERPVAKLRPERDRHGRVLAPARAWLTAAERPAPAPSGVAVALPTPGDLLLLVQAGDQLALSDARGRRRQLQVAERREGGAVVTTERTAYVEEGAELTLSRGGLACGVLRVTGLEVEPPPIVLRPGDTIVVHREDAPGRPAQLGADGRVIAPAHVGCTLGECFGRLLPGHSIWFDDGAIGGVIRENDGARLAVEIVHARAGGSRLRGEKGVNLPESDLQLPALTPKDLRDLEWIARNADAVELSFVRGPEDVRRLHERLHELEADGLGVVLKIENRAAFEQLPRILLEALRRPPVGVMVARGDLAVEVGFARLAEVQEEILWLAEAAHVPVIWATQVLETLARTGRPSRAEVTDAAMSARAECVMLNKGPHVAEAVAFLGGVLERMQAHHSKKRALLRPLAVSRAC
jgi:pyruvate kinase